MLNYRMMSDSVLTRPFSAVIGTQPVSSSVLSERSREVLRHLVDFYVATGEPMGSRTLSQRLGNSLSSASIRAVMADLEDLGLLHAPHISSGRLPTPAGLSLFVDGLLEVGRLSPEEQTVIQTNCAALGRSVAETLTEASGLLSSLSGCAGLVLAPKTDDSLRQVEFVALSPGRVLVVLVTEDGLVENRFIEAPLGLTASELVTASNFINRRLGGNSNGGQTLAETRQHILAALEQHRHEIDILAQNLIETGLACWSGEMSPNGQKSQKRLIVRGQASLLGAAESGDLNKIRSLFAALETEETILKLLETTRDAQSVQVFIGAENSLFAHSGWSMVVKPYMTMSGKMVGAIGVIGPSRLNYARIIPMVDYTARIVGQLLG